MKCLNKVFTGSRLNKQISHNINQTWKNLEDERSAKKVLDLKLNRFLFDVKEPINLANE